jgi:mRNA interferase RelE/StbE
VPGEGPVHVYRVEIATSAGRALADLQRGLRERIRERLRLLATAPRGRGVKKLTGRGGELRLRVGDHRVVVTVDDAARVVLVRYVGPRGEAYR